MLDISDMEFPIVEPHEAWKTLLYFSQYPAYESERAQHLSLIYDHQKHLKNAIASDVALTAKHGLFESPLDFFQSKSTGFYALHKFLEELVLLCAEAMNVEYWQGRKVDVDIVESWYHITQDSGYHDVHSHPNCSWCGIYVLEPGDSQLATRSGVNRFYDPRVNASHSLDAGSLYLNEEGVWDVEPQPGQVVIFPSYLKHAALPYFGESDRVVIAFNAAVNFC